MQFCVKIANESLDATHIVRMKQKIVYFAQKLVGLQDWQSCYGRIKVLQPDNDGETKKFT